MGSTRVEMTLLLIAAIGLGIGAGALVLGHLMAMDIRRNHADDKHKGWEEWM